MPGNRRRLARCSKKPRHLRSRWAISEFCAVPKTLMQSEHEECCTDVRYPMRKRRGLCLASPPTRKGDPSQLKQRLNTNPSLYAWGISHLYNILPSNIRKTPPSTPAPPP